jgi:hypothetical protein
MGTLRFVEISLCLSIIGHFSGCVIIGYILRMIKINQFHAYFGDKDAARHLLLPCYKPLFRSLWCANLLLIFIQLLFLLFFSDNSSTLLICIQFCEMSSLVLQSIPAILLCQPSVSISGFWRTGVVIFSWWLLDPLESFPFHHQHHCLHSHHSSPTLSSQSLNVIWFPSFENTTWESI